MGEEKVTLDIRLFVDLLEEDSVEETGRREIRGQNVTSSSSFSFSRSSCLMPK